VDPGDKRESNNVGDNEYAYLDQHLGVEMIVFHVDNYDFLHLIAKDIGFGTYGGNLSVRMPPPRSKPLIIFSQGESVFSQFPLKPKQWVGPLGQRALLQKTDGMSLMTSAFQSCETGFGL
jgi:hypothetical protein